MSTPEEAPRALPVEGKTFGPIEDICERERPSLSRGMTVPFLFLEWLDEACQVWRAKLN